MIKRKKMTILIISSKKGSAQPLINAIKSHEVIHFEHSELTSSLISNLGIIDVVIDINNLENQKEHNFSGLFNNSRSSLKLTSESLSSSIFFTACITVV